MSAEDIIKRIKDVASKNNTITEIEPAVSHILLAIVEKMRQQFHSDSEIFMEKNENGVLMMSDKYIKFLAYAFELGVESVAGKFKENTRDMQNALEAIRNICNTIK